MGAIKTVVSSLITDALTMVFPHQCRACSTIIDAKEVFCPPCLAKIQPIISVFLPITKNASLPVFALAAYEEPLRTLVLKKFNHDRLASKQLAKLMLQMSPLADLTVDIVIPVPLHWTRYAWRGFNQAVEMGKVIAKEKKAHLSSCVRRHKKTTFQSRLSAADRKKNVQASFSISPLHKLRGLKTLAGKHVVIVDDLCTTGATLVHVAKIILPLKPASLSAVVACRTL
jgi:ComF family protein